MTFPITSAAADTAAKDASWRIEPNDIFGLDPSGEPQIPHRHLSRLQRDTDSNRAPRQQREYKRDDGSRDTDSTWVPCPSVRGRSIRKDPAEHDHDRK